jgi:hypothetical protein
VTPPVILLPDPERNRLGFFFFFFPFSLFSYLENEKNLTSAIFISTSICTASPCGIDDLRVDPAAAFPPKKVGQAHIEPTGLKWLLQRDCPSIKRIIMIA